jgi:1L-myo-inositol 1-phosphate cytidylyltransferase
VPNPDWQEGNGTSVLAVAPHVQGPFLLLMCDHVFDPAILRELMAAARQTEACLLAVDPRIEGIFDLGDATKVQLVDDRVTAIGKELTAFNAIDTGLFLCRPMLFQALNQARTAGDGSLTGGVRRLIQTDGMQALPIGNRFWMDVDTTESLLQAEQMVLANLKSGGCLPSTQAVASMPRQPIRHQPSRTAL